MIWTTTPWTLAANLAVAVHPSLDYTTISYEKDGSKFISVVGTDRLEAILKAGKLEAGQYRVKLENGKRQPIRRVAIPSSICREKSNK